MWRHAAERRGSRQVIYEKCQRGLSGEQRLSEIQILVSRGRSQTPEIDDALKGHTAMGGLSDASRAQAAAVITRHCMEWQCSR
jgi:hypothetical protein